MSVFFSTFAASFIQFAMNLSIVRHTICLLCVLVSAMLTQAQIYQTRILSPDIRTLQSRLYDAETDRPYDGDPQRGYLVMQNGRVGVDGDRNGNILEISFDLMSGDYRQYTYSVVHLDRNYRVDDLISTEYIAGFTTQDITDYQPSFNTSQLYTHYRFLFPNEDMTVLASGNYALVIYETGYPDRIVAIQNVWVTEPQVKIETQVRSNTDIELYGRYQQLDITLSDLEGSSVMNDYSIRVRQNGRTDNEVVAPRPTYVESSRLKWSQCRDLIFEGGNEYRHLDIFSQFMAGTGVEQIRYDGNDYHAWLWQTPIRAEEQYMHEWDVDGQYRVHAERTGDVETEAEYMWVHFELEREDPWFDGGVYVGGEWNANRMDHRSAMQYNNQTRRYELTTLLKQGGYDFQFWFLEKGSKKATLLRTEGSHWQTGNEYRVYVYYRPIGARYDRLVGIR